MIGASGSNLRTPTCESPALPLCCGHRHSTFTFTITFSQALPLPLHDDIQLLSVSYTISFTITARQILVFTKL